MADTKKEHYVPRCYLKNFILENDKIKIFDKFKMQVREQRIMDVAMENYFYDIDFEELLQKAESDESEKIKTDLKNIVGTENWEDVKSVLDSKHIEKKFFAPMEDIYSDLLHTFISKSYNGNDWYSYDNNGKKFEFKISDKTLLFTDKSDYGYGTIYQDIILNK